VSIESASLDDSQRRKRKKEKNGTFLLIFDVYSLYKTWNGKTGERREEKLALIDKLEHEHAE
jgi:SET domain-containing protein